MARPRLVSDEQILRTMRERVIAHGPNVSLEVVAEELQVTAPALLKRFGSREALMLAALRPPHPPPWMQRVEQGPSEAPLKTQLEELFGEICSFMMDSVPCLSALRESGIPPTKLFSKENGPLQGLAALQRWLKRAKARGLVTAEELDGAAYAMLGALQTRVFFSHVLLQPYPPRARREYAKELAELFTRALAPRSP